VGWIELKSMHWGETKHLGNPGGTQLTMSKAVDRVTQHLMRASHNGDYFESAVLEIADAWTGRPTLRIKLYDIAITAHSSPDGETETFTLDVKTVEFNHNPVAEDELEEMLQQVFKYIGLGPTASRGARR
jgi:type VI protein secretion system component Hcp